MGGRRNLHGSGVSVPGFYSIKCNTLCVDKPLVMSPVERGSCRCCTGGTGKRWWSVGAILP